MGLMDWDSYLTQNLNNRAVTDPESGQISYAGINGNLQDKDLVSKLIATDYLNNGGLITDIPYDVKTSSTDDILKSLDTYKGEYFGAKGSDSARRYFENQYRNSFAYNSTDPEDSGIRYSTDYNPANFKMSPEQEALNNQINSAIQADWDNIYSNPYSLRSFVLTADGIQEKIANPIPYTESGTFWNNNFGFLNPILKAAGTTVGGIYGGPVGAGFGNLIGSLPAGNVDLSNFVGAAIAGAGYGAMSGLSEGIAPADSYAMGGNNALAGETAWGTPDNLSTFSGNTTGQYFNVNPTLQPLSGINPYDAYTMGGNNGNLTTPDSLQTFSGNTTGIYDYSTPLSEQIAKAVTEKGIDKLKRNILGGMLGGVMGDFGSYTPQTAAQVNISNSQIPIQNVSQLNAEDAKSLPDSNTNWTSANAALQTPNSNNSLASDYTKTTTIQGEKELKKQQEEEAKNYLRNDYLQKYLHGYIA